MTPEQYHRAQALFEALEAAPPESRGARLEELCPGDPEMRARVLELLGTDTQRVQSIDARLRRVFAPAEGERIGPYRLVRLLGQGGMGEVWLAAQEQTISRRVALKLVRGGMGTRAVLARFEAERQALGLMAHPCIAHVYDAGVTDWGLPYFVMEYVDGPPITEHCDRERLDLRQRLELFQRVCEGVLHAHQKAVLHRDLKPSNVLVQAGEGAAWPKIIDFGIAKALGAALQPGPLETRAGAVVGTPEYMSPERLSGADVAADTRTDVYALGMILYELLVGSLPIPSDAMSSGDPQRIHAAVTGGPLPRPSAQLGRCADAAAIARRRCTDPARLAAALRRDLDWIVMRTIEPDPSRRYASVAELSRDVCNYLEGRPVLARPPSSAYVAARFVRRHRAAVAGATLALAALVAGTVGTTAALIQAREAEVVARREAEAVEQTLQFVVGLFGQSNPLLAGGPNLTLRELLDVGATQLESASFADPSVPARLRQAIGRSYWVVSNFEGSQRLLSQALEELTATLGPDHPDTLRTQRYLAELYWAGGSLEEAEKFARAAVAGGERVLGKDDPETLEATAALVSVLGRRGKLQDALALGEEVVQRRRAFHGSHAPATATALWELALLKARAGSSDEAEAMHREALAIRRAAFGPDSLLTL